MANITGGSTTEVVNIDVHPTGDTILASAEDGGNHLRVASLVLSQASPLLETMLDKASDVTPSRNKILHMDDRGDVLLRLCAALHTLPDLFKPAKGRELFRFATVCMRYDVVSVVKPLVDDWFGQCFFEVDREYAMMAAAQFEKEDIELYLWPAMERERFSIKYFWQEMSPFKIPHAVGRFRQVPGGCGLASLEARIKSGGEGQEISWSQDWNLIAGAHEDGEPRGFLT